MPKIPRHILKGGLVGGGIGAVGGGVAGRFSQPGRRRGESQEAYRKRLRGAMVGGAIRGGLGGAFYGAAVADEAARRQYRSRPRGGYEGYRQRHGGGGGGGGFRPKPPQDPFQAAANKIKDPKVRNRAEAFARMAKQQKGTPEGANAMTRLRQHAQKHGFDADELFKHASFMLGVVEAFRD